MVTSQTAVIMAMEGTILCGMQYFDCSCCRGIWCIYTEYLDKVLVWHLQVPGRGQGLHFRLQLGASVRQRRVRHC